MLFVLLSLLDKLKELVLLCPANRNSHVPARVWCRVWLPRLMDKRLRQEDKEDCDHVSKRQHKDEEGKTSKGVLHIIKNKLTSSHYNHLKSLALKNGFLITESFK